MMNISTGIGTCFNKIAEVLKSLSKIFIESVYQVYVATFCHYAKSTSFDRILKANQSCV